MSLQESRRHPDRWLAAAGAACAAASIALSAYASHAAQGDAQSRLQLAAIFAFGHGAAIAALAPAAVRRIGQAALCGLLVGTLLFSGSLASNVLAGLPTTLAPLGGMLLIGSWLALAFDLWRG